MKQLLQRLYHKVVPESIRWNISRNLNESKYKEIKTRATDFFLKSENEEIRSIGNFLKHNSVAIFPYEYALRYNPASIQVFFDSKIGLSYVIYEGKRLYMKRGALPSKIKTLVNSLLIEQDPVSPHLYTDSTFEFENGDVLYDVGAAEGIFSLKYVEKAKKVYLFETEESWIEALQATFKPWAGKVEIVNKFVGREDSADGKFISLDSFVQDATPPTFIKADIEGAETDMLEGASRLLATDQHLKLAVCTYHNQQDAEVIENLLLSKGYSTSFTPGFMFCYNLDLQPPYLRKSVIRALK